MQLPWLSHAVAWFLSTNRSSVFHTTSKFLNDGMQLAFAQSDSTCLASELTYYSISTIAQYQHSVSPNLNAFACHRHPSSLVLFLQMTTPFALPAQTSFESERSQHKFASASGQDALESDVSDEDSDPEQDATPQRSSRKRNATQASRDDDDEVHDCLLCDNAVLLLLDGFPTLCTSGDKMKMCKFVSCTIDRALPPHGFGCANVCHAQHSWP